MPAFSFGYSNLTVLPWQMHNTPVGDLKDLTIQAGIHVVNPGAKNLPADTYGIVIVIPNANNLWRYVFFVPTHATNIYLIFYNGYGNEWTNWKAILN